jgi:hypothetical protein
MRSTIIALAYPGWTFNNNSTKDNPLLSMPYTLCIIYCHTKFLFIAICFSAFVMWLLLCAISLRCMVLSVVAVRRHSLPPMPTFHSSPGYCIVVFCDVFPSNSQNPFFFLSTYCTSLDRLEDSELGRRQLNAPVFKLICRLACLPHRLYELLVLCTVSLSSTSMKKPLHLFAHTVGLHGTRRRTPLCLDCIRVCDVIDAT